MNGNLKTLLIVIAAVIGGGGGGVLGSNVYAQAQVKENSSSITEIKVKQAKIESELTFIRKTQARIERENRQAHDAILRKLEEMEDD